MYIYIYIYVQINMTFDMANYPIKNAFHTENKVCIFVLFFNFFCEIFLELSTFSQ